MRSRRHRTIRTLLAGSLLAAGTVMGAPTASAVSYPAGRPTFVVATLGGPVNAVAVRLSTYQFSTDGTVRQNSWSWRQDSITGKGNVSWSKPYSGYTTTGCLRACPIRTPFGFQSGRLPSVAYGRYTVSGSTLRITWGKSLESWQIDNSKPGVAALHLITSNPTSRGWGLGSKQGMARAVSIKGMAQAGYLTGPFASNSYAETTRFVRMGFNPVDHSVCSNGTCLQNKYNTGPDKSKWFNAYFATNPARDGRKVFYNMQNGYVAQVESPGTDCISVGGGHTIAALQALNDAGELVGLVGVEASLNQRSAGQAVVGAFAMAAYRYQNSSTPLLK